MRLFGELAKRIKKILIDIQYYWDPVWRLKRSGASIGNHVFIGSHTYIELEHAKLLTIQDEVVLSAHTKIILHDSSLQNVAGKAVLFGPVVIQKGAYIGANTTILPGSNIGEKTIVGANSLVTGDLLPNTVYVGQPARKISTVTQLIKKRQITKKPSVFYKSQPKWFE